MSELTSQPPEQPMNRPWVSMERSKRTLSVFCPATSRGCTSKVYRKYWLVGCVALKYIDIIRF